MTNEGFSMNNHQNPQANPYEVLGIASNASDEEIKKAFRSEMLLNHPDRSNDKDANSKTLAIQAAYEVLIDPKKRKLFDEQSNSQAKFKSLIKSKDVFPPQKEDLLVVIYFTLISPSDLKSAGTTPEQDGLIFLQKAYGIIVDRINERQGYFIFKQESEANQFISQKKDDYPILVKVRHEYTIEKKPDYLERYSSCHSYTLVSVI